MFYSKSLGGIYDNDAQEMDIPSDAVELSEEEVIALLQGQAQGKIITIGDEGKPILVDPPARIFYAKSTSKFYDTRLQGETIPDDAVSLTDEKYAALFEGQTLGKVISADKKGNPILIDPPAPSAEEMLAANSAKRNELLTVAYLSIAPLQDAVDLDDASAEEAALLKVWKQYRVALNRLDVSVQSPTWPALPA
jgi:hypothetical protein